MFISTVAGATALTVSANPPSGETSSNSPTVTASSILSNPPGGPCPRPDHIRHLLFGTPATVQTTIRLLHHLGYAEPNDWSRPISTGRANEVMAILTKRIRLG
ncbi:MAG: hypothetical protein AAFV85_27750 [Cyanobacteria bacterium J06634_6]